jgi:nucleoside-diphosphate-sugar epimerase
MPTTAFVTGGSGFIGGALIRRLRSDGWTVRALARSDAAAEKVSAAGAEPVGGDLDDAAAMATGAGGCEVAFHAAAALGEWGRREDFERGNVRGTRNALEAARRAGVRRFVHVGTEAALLAGEPLVDVDETAPLRPDSRALYSATKAQAEQAVREANGDGLETVVVRPRLVWGVGDTTILPALVEAVRSGRFRWIGGGRHRTSTTHVENAVHGLVLGAERGAPGGVYFVTDGEPVVFCDFVVELLATQHVEPPDSSVPDAVARAAAPALEGIWRTLRLKGQPPLTRLAYWLSAQECTIDISRARRELGYEPVKSIPEGMAELRAAAAS